jgi:hypothetical protein
MEQEEANIVGGEEEEEEQFSSEAEEFLNFIAANAPHLHDLLGSESENEMESLPHDDELVQKTKEQFRFTKNLDENLLLRESSFTIK